MSSCATFPFAIPTLQTGGFTPNFGFCALNPIGAVTGAVVPEHYYGFVLPAWVPALFLNGTLTALLVLAAMNRLEDFPAHRAAALRGVTLLFAGLLVFFGNGIVLGIAPTTFAPLWMQMLFMLCIAAVLLLLFVPVLVTGDLEGWPQKRGWSPLRMFTQASLPSGLPLALLLAFLTLGLTLWAVHLAPTALGLRANSFAGLLPTHLGVAAPSSVSTRDVLNCLWQGALMLVLVVAGISGLGFLLSVLLNNRWSSLTLLYLALILAIALPFFSYGVLRGTDAVAAAHSPAVNSLYLCPFYPLVQLSDTIHPGYAGIGHDDVASGMIGFQSYPLWVGTGIVYGVIGLVSYGTGLAVLRRRRTATRSA